MQKLCMIPFLVITIVSSHTVSSECPTSCFCLAGYVTCSDLKSIPTAFPAETRSLSITNIDVDEIPAGVFEKLFQIESIEIYLGNIGKISSDAFSSLSSMDLITLNELTIGTIESYAFSNMTDIGTISIYMSKIDTIQRYAFTDLFALDEIKLFMLDVKNIDSFAMTNIDEVFHFHIYTNNIGTMQPYAISNFANVHKLSLYLNTFGHLGCGSIEMLVSDTYEQSVYSNSVNCSCDLLWIVSDVRLNKYLFSNWCQVPDMNERVYWEDISSDTLQCDLKVVYVCPPATTFETEISYTEPLKVTSQTVTKQVSSTIVPSDTVFTSRSTISSFIEYDSTVLQTDKTSIVPTTKALKSTIPSEPVFASTSSTSDQTTTVFASTSPASEPTSFVSESASFATWPTSPASDPTPFVSESALFATWPTSSASESMSSVSNSSSSVVVQPSRPAPTVTLSLDTTKETRVPAGSLSEKITTRQTESKFWTDTNPRTTTTEEARVTDFLLISTKKVQNRTKPKVVISDETDVIKAVSSSPERLQPQNVSHNVAASRVSGSTKLCSVVSLLFLTLIVKI